MDDVVRHGKSGVKFYHEKRQFYIDEILYVVIEMTAKVEFNVMILSSKLISGERTMKLDSRLID